MVRSITQRKKGSCTYKNQALFHKLKDADKAKVIDILKAFKANPVRDLLQARPSRSGRCGRWLVPFLYSQPC